MKHKYSKEEDDFLKNNVKGISLKELAKRFNKKFNYNLSESAISNRKNKLKLRSGITGGRFTKGSLAWNKGKKRKEYMNINSIKKCERTQFKKGNIPHNHRNIFEERITKDGYIEIKIEEPNKWESKQRYIYKKHYGNIPEEYNIIFLDGNKRNFEISNLKAVSKGEDLIMNNNHFFTSNKEITNTGSNIAKVICKTCKLKKENKND